MYDEPQPPESDSSVVMLAIKMSILVLAVIFCSVAFCVTISNLKLLVPVLYCVTAVGGAAAICWAMDGYHEAKTRVHYWYIIKRNNRNAK